MGFDIVLDANIAIGDLLYKHRNPHLKQTALQEIVKSGVVRLYAPSWLEAEMLSSTIPHDAGPYAKRNLVERLFCRMKDRRRLTIRYEKWAENVLNLVRIFAIRYSSN